MSSAQNCNLIYFSPTATTRTILENVAQGMGSQVDLSLDITLSNNRHDDLPLFDQDPVLIGAPVYSGRVAPDAAAYFKKLKGNGAPAVVVVVFGNRAYEDALLELKDICSNCGFTPVAGAAFIGEHSFSTPKNPIALHRPDEADLQKAFEFGQDIDRLLTQTADRAKMALTVPGNLPYKDVKAAAPAAFIEVSDDCDECGICASVCPKDAIDDNNYFETDEQACIHCCACIKSCPRSARQMVSGPFKEKSKELAKTCSERKEPEIFLGGQV